MKHNEDQIDYIEAPSQDLAATRKFFSRLFGWQFESWGDDYISYGDGRIQGGFFQSETVPATASGSVLIVFYSETLETTLKHIEKLGGTVVRDIFEFPGGRRFHFTEPGGGEYAMWSER